MHDPVEVIHFTEQVSVKIQGLMDEAKIYRTVVEEFARSKLRIAETSVTPEKLKAAEN